MRNIEQVNCIVQFLMSFISELMPYFIFLIILRLILNNTLSVFGSVWKLFVLFLCGTAVLCAIFTGVTVMRFKVSPLTLLRKSLPTFLIALTTASSAAAFISAMLAIATPPIPGGGAAAYTMLFARLCIPTDALAVVLSMDILFDFFRTAVNMYDLPLELIHVANSMGKLDYDTLRKESIG